jgi:phytoene dehydrogenase-like protein
MLQAVSIPTVLDPSLAPAGHHVIHAYCAGNEPYALWEGLQRSSSEYKGLKEQRSEVLWRAIERIIPDVRLRTVLALSGSPLTHERFNRRVKGTYGPAFTPGKESLPGIRTPIRNLLQCGDSVFPGIGVPAVAVSGAEAAHTLVSVWKQLKTLNKA